MQKSSVSNVLSFIIIIFVSQPKFSISIVLWNNVTTQRLQWYGIRYIVLNLQRTPFTVLIFISFLVIHFILLLNWIFFFFQFILYFRFAIVEFSLSLPLHRYKYGYIFQQFSLLNWNFIDSSDSIQRDNALFWFKINWPLIVSMLCSYVCGVLYSIYIFHREIYKFDWNFLFIHSSNVYFIKDLCVVTCNIHFEYNQTKRMNIFLHHKTLQSNFVVFNGSIQHFYWNSK